MGHCFTEYILSDEFCTELTTLSYKVYSMSQVRLILSIVEHGNRLTISPPGYFLESYCDRDYCKQGNFYLFKLIETLQPDFHFYSQTI